MRHRVDLISQCRRIAAISGLLIVATAARAHAQSAEAESLFTEGERLMKQEKLDQACEAFEASNRIEPRAGTLIQLGECREQNHQLASAWSAYKDALGRVKDPRKKAFAEAKVTAIEPRLSYLTVSVADDSRVEGLTLTRNGQPLDPALWNRGIPVNGGEQVIGGRAPGHEEWKTTVTVPVESGRVSVEVPRFKEIAKLVPPPSPEPLPVPTVPTASPAPSTSTSATMSANVGDTQDALASSSRWTVRRKLAIGLAGGSATGLVVGIVLGTQARSKQDEAHQSCASTTVACDDAVRANQLISEGRSRALGANIAFGATAAVAVGAGVLWFTGASEAPAHHVAVAPILEPGRSGVAVFGWF